MLFVHYKLVLLASLLAVSMNAQAFWQCSSFDKRLRSYTATHFDEKVAMQQAQKACHRHKRTAGRCITANSYCTRIREANYQYRCIITDRHGKRFVANNCQKAIQSCHLWQFRQGSTHANGCIASSRSI